MTDRIFTLEDDLPESISLNIPPFLNGEAQLSLSSKNETRQIASIRVHAESAIEGVKHFKILSQLSPCQWIQN